MKLPKIVFCGEYQVKLTFIIHILVHCIILLIWLCVPVISSLILCTVNLVKAYSECLNIDLIKFKSLRQINIFYSNYFFPADLYHLLVWTHVYMPTPEVKTHCFIRWQEGLGSMDWWYDYLFYILMQTCNSIIAMYKCKAPYTFIKLTP